jgi:hypothetical protein
MGEDSLAVSRRFEERATAIGQKRDKCRIHRASSRSTCASDSGVFFTASATRARREKFRETRSASIDERILSPSHGVTLSHRAQKRKESGLFPTELYSSSMRWKVGVRRTGARFRSIWRGDVDSPHAETGLGDPNRTKIYYLHITDLLATEAKKPASVFLRKDRGPWSASADCGPL